MAFDQRLALLYGDFVQAVYKMCDPKNPDVLTPPPSSDFPGKALAE
jgi:hypothetical protein